MESTGIIIDFKNPIKILTPKPIQRKITEYIIKWENRGIPSLIEFIFQDDKLGYNIRKAIIKLGTLENLEIDKIFHIIYDDKNNLDIILEIYEYDSDSLSLIITDEDNKHKIITDIRSLNNLNEEIDRICKQANEFDEFLDGIISTFK